MTALPEDDPRHVTCRIPLKTSIKSPAKQAPSTWVDSRPLANVLGCGSRTFHGALAEACAQRNLPYSPAVSGRFQNLLNCRKVLNRRTAILYGGGAPLMWAVPNGGMPLVAEPRFQLPHFLAKVHAEHRFQLSHLFARVHTERRFQKINKINILSLSEDRSSFLSMSAIAR